MSKIGVFFADGCEEIEGLTVVDLARRGGLECVAISINGKDEVTGSHSITFKADAKASDVDFDSLDGIVLPGGLPGTYNLRDSETVQEIIKKFASEEKLVAAICAAPSVLGGAGLLVGKKATCNPGWEEHLKGATCVTDNAVKDGNIITSRGMGTAMDFGLAILEYFDIDTEKIRRGTVWK